MDNGVPPRNGLFTVALSSSLTTESEFVESITVYGCPVIARTAEEIIAVYCDRIAPERRQTVSHVPLYLLAGDRVSLADDVEVEVVFKKPPQTYRDFLPLVRVYAKAIGRAPPSEEVLFEALKRR
jgi:hypothetical protein